MKKDKIRSILLVVLTVGILWYILKDNFDESVSLLLGANIWYLLLVVVTYLVYFAIEAYLLYLLINKIRNCYSYRQSLELNLMTKFFNGITPFSLGGQPLQMYELSKSKVRVTEALLVLVENFIILQISMTIMAIISLIVCINTGLIPNKFLWILTLLGVFITLFSLFMAIFMCVKINVAKKIGYKIIGFLKKIHLIKMDLSRARDLWRSKCDEYYTTFNILLKDKMFVVKCVLLNILYMTIFCLIPFFVFRALDVNLSANVIYSIILGCFVYISASFIPIPGATIGMEYAFINYFKLIVASSLVMPGVLVWRLVSYYVPMILGGIMFNVREAPLNRMRPKNPRW